MKAAITNTLLKNLPAGPVDIYDTKLTGFVLRVRKSGRASYRVNYGRGKWYTLGRLTDLKPAQARELAHQILGEAAKGNDPGAARKRAKAKTLREFITKVYAPWLRTNRKHAESYLASLDAHFVAELGAKRLDQITPWVIEKWRMQRRKAGIKPATINRNLDDLRAALHRAVEWGYIDTHPFAGAVKPLKLDSNKRVRFLDPDEEARLRVALEERSARVRQERDNANAWRRERGYAPLPNLRAARYVDHLEPIVVLCLNTGLRRGELFNLAWEDIDLKRAMLTVEGAGAKSGKTRHVPLNDEARQVLTDWQATTGKAEGLVFPGPTGNRLNNITKSWTALLKAAKITSFRFHDCRHTFASRLVMAGVDLNTVRELLGHADLKMTLRYAHLAPEHKADAVAKLNRAAATFFDGTRADPKNENAIRSTPVPPSTTSANVSRKGKP